MSRKWTTDQTTPQIRHKIHGFRKKMLQYLGKHLGSEHQVVRVFLQAAKLLIETDGLSLFPAMQRFASTNGERLSFERIRTSLNRTNLFDNIVQSFSVSIGCQFLEILNYRCTLHMLRKDIDKALQLLTHFCPHHILYIFLESPPDAYFRQSLLTYFYMKYKIQTNKLLSL